MRLYLCYAPEDKSTAFNLADLFEKNGYRVAFDDVLEADQPLPQQLETLIDRHDVFVYVITANTRKSEWCQWEFATAAELGKPIVMLPPDNLPDIDELRGRIAHAPPSRPTDAPPKPAQPAGMPSRTPALPTVVLTEIPDAPPAAPIIQDKKPPLRWWLAGAAALVIGLFLAAISLPNMLTPKIPTATPTPIVVIISPTPRPLPTLLPGQPFPPDTPGFVLLPPDDAAQTILEALQTAGIPHQRIDETFITRDDALEIATTYRAAGVLRGERYGAGVQVYFELNPSPAANDAEAPVMQPLMTFTMFSFFDTTYLAEFLRGVTLYHEGEFEAAAMLFNLAEAGMPADRLNEIQPVALYWYRGAARDAIGEFQMALEDFNRVLAILPEDPAAYSNRALTFYHLGEFDEAVADYDRALALLPDDALLHYRRGNAYFSQGNYAAALADYNRAIILNPDYAPAYNNRGAVYARQEQYALAVADFNQSLRLLPDYTEAYRNRALAYRLQGEADKAIADYTRLLELLPNDAAAYLARGRLYAEQENFSAAVGDYNRLLALTPDNARAYYERGVLQTLRGNQEAALADLTQAVALAPEFPAPYAVLGTIYQARGELEAARENYRKHLNLAGDEALEIARLGLQQLEATPTPPPEADTNE